MIDVLAALNLGTVTPVAALVATYVWLIRAVTGGTVISSSAHRMVVDGLESQNRNLTEALTRSQEQNRGLMEQGETSLRLLRSIATTPAEGGDGDDSPTSG